MYLPHAQTILQYQLKSPSTDDQLAKAVLLGNVSSYFHFLGDYKAAATTAKGSLDLREKYLGGNHLETLFAMRFLAECLSSGGNYASAERCPAEHWVFTRAYKVPVTQRP
jgi:hypothetical protein